ncbi:LysR family transcriptional regulator [Lichenifustis flavocetrariae]|uniref:LysR family transcriptional regulator n=1 Tax=Lichenifustis flavocetrariae TaxID=2949735 RepID=A0AA42CMV4_9HYPH|nr:LysR family transcriptional regulator [Lichenifustis flavocetrariae]MCW6508777.1 LysR family transcriptional regulator [Lichenifustis flavocetrariae]
MDRLTSMAAYVTVVERGSFAATATALGISPQMVAKHVSFLEARLGTRLLNRTTRRQSLTEIGRSFYDRCKIVLADVDWADALAEETKGEPRGRLRINAPVSFGVESLMPVVTRYLREHRNVEVDLVLSDRFVDLDDDEFEAVFRTGPLADGSLAAHELTPFRLVACAAPTYLRERGTPREPSDLDAHECLGHAHWSQPTNYPWRFVREGQAFEPQVRSRLRVSDAKALLTAALDGFGIVLIAEDVVRQALAAGQLVRILPDFQTPSRPMHLLFRADRRKTPKLRSFIDAVVAAFPPDRSQEF